jgi:hypothetical protein
MIMRFRSRSLLLRSFVVLARCAALGTILAMASAGLAAGVERRLAADGTVHTITVEARPATAGGGTKLVHRIQGADGTITTLTVPGTDDPIVEADPTLVFSSTGGTAVLVWSRAEGGDYEIADSVFDRGAWSPAPRILTANSLDDRKPMAIAAPSGTIQIFWKATSSTLTSPAFYHSVLDSKGVPLLQPLEITVPAGTGSGPDGTDATGLGPNDLLFAFDSVPKTGPTTVVAFGGTDEPIPTVHRVDFVQPAMALPIDHVKIERIGSTVILLFRNSKSLVYYLGTASGWSPARAISIDSSVTEEAAELLIIDRIQRSVTP